VALRALCNGKTLAFQARDAGSIPAARSKILQGSRSNVLIGKDFYSCSTNG
jgi:hypothetical protein